MEVVRRGGGNKVVVLAWCKLHATRRRGEGAKCDGEIHEFMWFVTYRDDSGVWLRNATSLELIFGHAVNNGLFFVLRTALSGPIDRANNVDLVILPRLIAPVDVDDMVGIIYAKYRIGCVPMDIVRLFDGLYSAY